MKPGALIILLSFAPVAALAADRPFDGAWLATVTCGNSEDALGYSLAAPSIVRDGHFHGERLKPGQPGWLTIDGDIADDGRANLYAKGLVGAAPYAVGRRPKGTDYGYHIEAHFEPSRGLGHRVEGRPCEVSFARQ